MAFKVLVVPLILDESINSNISSSEFLVYILLPGLLFSALQKLIENAFPSWLILIEEIKSHMETNQVNTEDDLTLWSILTFKSFTGLAQYVDELSDAKFMTNAWESERT